MIPACWLLQQNNGTCHVQIEQLFFEFSNVLGSMWCPNHKGILHNKSENSKITFSLIESRVSGCGVKVPILYLLYVLLTWYVPST